MSYIFTGLSKIASASFVLFFITFTSSATFADTITSTADVTGYAIFTLANTSLTNPVSIQIDKSGTFSINTSGLASGFFTNTITGLPSGYVFSATSGAGQEPQTTFLLSIPPNEILSFLVTTNLGASAFASGDGSSSVSVLEQGIIALTNTSTNGAAFTLSLTGAYGFELSVLGSSSTSTFGRATATRAFALNGNTLINNISETTGGTVTEPLEEGPTTPFGTFQPGHSISVGSTLGVSSEATAVPEPSSLAIFTVFTACLSALNVLHKRK